MHPEGLYNPALRFAFTNITEEPFVSYWDGQPMTVPAGQTVELPQYLAVKMTKELTDKIMIGEAKLDALSKGLVGAQTPRTSQLGVPAARKVWEDKICRVLDVDEESPQVQVMRAQIKAELLADLSAEAQPKGTPELPSSLGEFAELKKTPEPKKMGRPIKLKEVK